MRVVQDYRSRSEARRDVWNVSVILAPIVAIASVFARTQLNTARVLAELGSLIANAEWNGAVAAILVWVESDIVVVVVVLWISLLLILSVVLSGLQVLPLEYRQCSWQIKSEDLELTSGTFAGTAKTPAAATEAKKATKSLLVMLGTRLRKYGVCSMQSGRATARSSVERKVACEMISMRHHIYVVSLKQLMQPRATSRLESKLVGLSWLSRYDRQ